MSFWERTESLIGKQAQETLAKSSVIVLGVGGVGSYAVEALARSGVGKITVVDGDTVSESNINRQLIATVSSIGKPKAIVSCDRINDISPQCNAIPITDYYSETTKINFDFSKYDYVVDCIDDTWAKLDIIQRCIENNVKIISSMGTGNKLDPTAFKITDISKTHTCPLARSIRTKLKQRGIYKGVSVVFSTENPVCNATPPGSISYVPATAGLLIASQVIKELIK